MHGRHRVAGVDRPHEGICRHYFDDVGNLRHIQQCGDARSDVLAGGVGRKQDVAVAACMGDDDRRQRLGELVLVGGTVDVQHLGDTDNLPCGHGGGARIAAGHQHVHIGVDGGSSRHGIKNDGNDCRIVVIGDDENSHQMTPTSFFSLLTSSATVSTLIPPSRCDGSVTFSVVRRGAMSTPSSSGVISAISFFFAFMMFGSDA